MKKIGIIVDSYACLTEEQAHKLNFEFINQGLTLDGVEYQDGINIFTDKDRDKIDKAKTVNTSLPTPAKVEAAFKAMSKACQNVLFFPMNKGISSTYSASVQQAKEFKNIYVIDHKMVGGATVEVAREVQRQAEKGISIEKILKWVEEFSSKTFCYLIPKDIRSMIRGGRLKGIKKVVLEKARLIPLLYVGETGVEVKRIKRNFQKSVASAVEDLLALVLPQDSIDDYQFEIIHFGDEDSVKVATENLTEQKVKPANVAKRLGSSIVAAHTGINAIGINFWKKIKGE